jgi:mRNA-degrading endonuclease toxin of MazEF toxin-antitoxin module
MMKRGEIWEADIGGRAGKRPVLILTRSRVIPYLSKVVVAEITTKGKGYPTQIDIGQQGNLTKHSYVSAESLHSLPKERLIRNRGELSDFLLKKVSQAVIFALELM